MSSSAAWKLGLVKSTYFRWEPAGNQCVGSIVAGLQLYSSDFARVPPTFDDESAEARNYVDKTIGGIFAEVFPPDEYLKSVIPRNHDIYGWTGTVLPAGM
eukprot:699086-Hanusia_phi.AAC.1